MGIKVSVCGNKLMGSRYFPRGFFFVFHKINLTCFSKAERVIKKKNYDNDNDDDDGN